MGKVIRLNESQLKSIIEKIIQEQQFQPGQQYQKGKQSTIASGQQAQAAVINAGRLALKGAKQILVTIGKTAFNVVIYGGAIIYLIGKSAYKVSAAIGNALFKFLASTGKATVAAATAVGDATITGLKAAGVAIEKGAQAVSAWVGSLKDQSVAIIKWVFNLYKQFGAAVWGKILIAGGAIRDFSAALGSWLKDSYNTVAKQIGVGWDQAMNLGKQGISAIKNTANKIERIGIFLRAGKSYDWITKELSVSKKTIADIKKSALLFNIQSASGKSEVYT
jgi:hypothetical protein